MVHFLEYQVVTCYRLPIGDDGTPAGLPQVTKNFSRVIKDSREKKVKKVTAALVAEQGEDLEL